MSNAWITWTSRNQEFAPVIGLHKHALFYPTTVNAFLKESCDLMVLMGVDRNGAIYGRITNFPNASIRVKIQWMLHRKLNKNTQLS